MASNETVRYSAGGIRDIVLDNMTYFGDYLFNKSNGTCTESNCSEIKTIPYTNVWEPAVIQRVVTLAVIMFLTIVGNSVIIIVLSCSKYRKTNSRVNIFIINLAIGDLTVCVVTMTTEVLFVCFGEWVLGAAACKILLWAQIVTLASTTFILTAMSFDRFLAICRPLSFGTTMSRSRKMIAACWLMACVFAVPQLFIFVQTDEGFRPDGREVHKCKSKGYTAWWQRELYFTFMTCYILVIPALLISYCYINVVRVVWRQGKEIQAKGSDCALRRTMGNQNAIPRAKIKTIKMTLSIIITFIACWSPYFVCHLIRIWTEYRIKIAEPVMVFAETIALLNSALNPILYGCFNIKLKRGLLEVFCPSRLRESNRFRSFKSGMSLTECMSLTEGDQGCISTAKRVSSRCREPNSGGSSTSSREDTAKNSINLNSRLSVLNNRAKGCAIEENRNGFRLKVKCMTSDRRGNKQYDPLIGKTASDEKEVADYVTTI